MRPLVSYSAKLVQTNQYVGRRRESGKQHANENRTDPLFDDHTKATVEFVICHVGTDQKDPIRHHRPQASRNEKNGAGEMKDRNSKSRFLPTLCILEL